jgi:hypothetical protein
LLKLDYPPGKVFLAWPRMGRIVARLEGLTDDGVILWKPALKSEPSAVDPRQDHKHITILVTALLPPLTPGKWGTIPIAAPNSR